MKNTILQLNIEQLLPKAQEDFARLCGFRAGSDKHRRMAQMADDVLQKGKSGLKPAAVVSAYESSVLRADKAVLDGVTFQCAAFARIDASFVRKLYAFILTAGEVSAEGGGAMESLYASMWGTAFAYAATSALSEILAENAGDGSKMAIFGPGFYGMDLSNIPLIFRILDGSGIGVAIREKACYMVPLKSCAGFMLATHSLAAFPPADCMNCVGNRGGCHSCRNNKI